MPTSAKLVAALWFAAVGWLAANAHVPALGENAQIGFFREITAAIGLLCGWMVSGALAGRGGVEAVGTGLRTSVTLTFFALLVFSVWQMVQLAFRRTYNEAGPMGAVMGAFELMIENAVAMLSVGVIGVLVLGGVVGGLVVEAAGRRWR
ncbi:TrgA family protein [Pseudogemmobacter sonorensis]|uniref:TrgA family protein n=1 Tax=Pseudogemmobacter sonorensis TaxID=2989681 RepID=UPI0036C3D3F5